MRELLICDGCGHIFDGVRDLRVLDDFAGADFGGDVDVLLVECGCGDRGTIAFPPAA